MKHFLSSLSSFQLKKESSLTPEAKAIAGLKKLAVPCTPWPRTMIGWR